MSIVRIWEQDVVIPTYGVGEKNKNPMFLEKRVYQGSSGKVYPLAVIDKILDEKTDKHYSIIFLENEYIQVQIMPELGGRVYRALDKTTNYDFVYYNRVIKPALVGLTGPWISGGVEFNWPQHHRPNTFGPVEYLIDDRSPVKATLWVSETDRIFGTKVTTGFTLYPDKSYIEISGQFYNPTSEPQSFLWWANPAVSVHDRTRSIFPPDVKAVMDHGKRDVSRFPISTSTYYKMDYSAGVDISWYKNIPVPTSYMAYKSDYDFMGGYDYSIGAGVLHVADHHIAPGKKQWTWGCGDFGKAWDRNLTDADGPYVELMTGVYTDNQPDFTWIAPYEEKTFTQYFMPYIGVGQVKNASVEAAVGLEYVEGHAKLAVYATSRHENASIVLKGKSRVYINETATISPTGAFMAEADVFEPETDLMVSIADDSGRTLVTYRPKPDTLEPMPEPATAIGPPETLNSAESLLLAGMHLEQYRHATFRAEDYYLEGLRRDGGDIRLNNAYGNLLMKRGDFKKAEGCFRAAVRTLTRHNPNPYDGEAFYNLGKALQYQGYIDDAFDSFYKSVWTGPMQSPGYMKLGQIASLRRDYRAALDYAEKSLAVSGNNYKARNIKSAVLRKSGNINEAVTFTGATLSLDPTDLFARSEQAIADSDKKGALLALLRNDPHNNIRLAEEYAEIGFYDDAISVLETYIDANDNIYPMVYYYLADYEDICGADAAATLEKARLSNPSYCFPNTPRDRAVLEKSIRLTPDSMAMYYLGCLLYDKQEYDDAIIMWTRSCEISPGFPTAHRNLALAYANKRSDYNAARAFLERAFGLNRSDSRVFYELIELYKKINMPQLEILAVLEGNIDLVFDRDDLYIEYVTSLNFAGNYAKAIDLLLDRHFHPWEGGEGKVPAQYVEARVGLAKSLISAGMYEEAIAQLCQAKTYRENFGEGKLAGAQENNIDYYIGESYAHIDGEKAKYHFGLASEGIKEPAAALYYNDQPPHMIFYQGLALMALDRENEARSRFNSLISYGENNMFKKQSIDYFAVSLPDFLVFETDLDLKNRIHCNYMMALGYCGLGDRAKSEYCCNEVIRLDPNHLGIKNLLTELDARGAVYG